MLVSMPGGAFSKREATWVCRGSVAEEIDPEPLQVVINDGLVEPPHGRTSCTACWRRVSRDDACVFKGAEVPHCGGAISFDHALKMRRGRGPACCELSDDGLAHTAADDINDDLHLWWHPWGLDVARHGPILPDMSFLLGWPPANLGAKRHDSTHATRPRS